jgi:hypothetical protein
MPEEGLLPEGTIVDIYVPDSIDLVELPPIEDLSPEEVAQLSEQEREIAWRQSLVRRGRLISPPRPMQPRVIEHFEPVEAEGEPLSEIIIRERG